MARARTVFFGSGAFAVPVLDAVARAPELSLEAVVTAPPRPAGRRAAPAPTAVGARAAELGIPLLHPERLRDPAFLAALNALQPAVGLLADYGKLLPPAVLDLAPRGILNLHPSLLPRHRGATPVPAAILDGDAETGVTLFRMDAGMDTGPLVAGARTPVEPGEDAPGLEARLADLAGELVARSIGPYLRGEIVPHPQPATGISITRLFDRRDGRLDAELPAALLERRVRALRPWPGTFVELPEGRLAVLGAAVAPAARGDQPGTLVAEGAGLALATGAGRLLLLEVRPAGGRPMDGAAYRRGHPAAVGSRVG
ncbi:MAG TPA: methionyl-tRNA formyltransferase [Patescibacteria group bacterium]|nr:methionyl-tRNA formyltransferase [Patescibacteria group bacterium]